VRGATDAGADDIIVVDTHGAGGDRNFNSVIRESLQEGCRYFSQYQWFDFEALLLEGCDAAIIVGMHAMAGTSDGVLAHTASYKTWMECRINGQPVGETAILAALCSHHGCPVVMVTGDEAVCREAEKLVTPSPVTAAVKRGIGRFSAVHLHPGGGPPAHRREGSPGTEGTSAHRGLPPGRALHRGDRFHLTRDRPGYSSLQGVEVASGLQYPDQRPDVAGGMEPSC